MCGGRKGYDPASPCREATPMHKYAAATALAIALNITMLALAISALLTPANGGDFSPAHPSRALIWPRGEAMRNKYMSDYLSFGVGAMTTFRRVDEQCRDGSLTCPRDCRGGWRCCSGFCDIVFVTPPAIVACIAKCVKAKEAARR
jgi:hypothetical protein